MIPADANVLLAFSLTLLAGLSTGLGSLLAFFTRQTNRKFLSLALGFSAGVMIYVSFVEILTKAKKTLMAATDATTGTWATAGAFFGGILLIAVIDRLIPAVSNPHEPHPVEDLHPEPDAPQRTLMRTGLVTALAVTIHNFPEGLATFAATLQNPDLGVSIALAIAIHNIPEGIAVSVPVFYASGSRVKAFGYALLSGIAEPLGALLGYLVLMRFAGDWTSGVLFAMVAGIMVFISLDELLPTAEAYGEHHVAVYGLVLGMAVMALSLLLLM